MQPSGKQSANLSMPLLVLLRVLLLVHPSRQQSVRVAVTLTVMLSMRPSGQQSESVPLPARLSVQPSETLSMPLSARR